MTMEDSWRQGEVVRLAGWLWRIDVWLSGSRGSSVEMEEEERVGGGDAQDSDVLRAAYGCRGAGMSLVKDGARIAVKSGRDGKSLFGWLGEQARGALLTRTNLLRAASHQQRRANQAIARRLSTHVQASRISLRHHQPRSGSC
jgi:hypothetical protein